MENMGEEGTGVPRDFILKQIENEMAAARRALRMSQPAGRETADSQAGQVRAVTRQVAELRETIDNLAARLLAGEFQFTRDS
jgi:hypothetical protein